jgi:N utilization substance protein B
MLNRRQLRIKILQSLYAFFQSDNENYNAGLKELMHSVSKMHEMYVYYMLVFGELVNYSESKIKETKNRKFSKANSDELNRNFIDNVFLQLLSNNPSLKQISQDLKINWSGDVEQDIIKKLYNHITKTDVYNEIMSDGPKDFEMQKAMCVQLFKKEICNYHLIHNYFEENSIYWTDDIDHICSMVIKTMKSIDLKNANDFPVLPLWKEDEEDFTIKLFENTIKFKSDNDSLLKNYTKNWDQDRLAKMDMILMNMAINEAREFPTIPVKVTLNEYIEISKFYSTPKSNGFINGILDNIFEHLKKEGQIIKSGRGLIE